MRGVVGESRLNILLVTAPAPVGGLETVVASLATGLAGRGHRVTVAASVGPDPHPFVDRLRVGGIAVVPTPEDHGAERRALIALAGEVGAGVVHSHGYRSDVMVRSARGKLRRPIVSTVHGFTGGGAKNRFYEWLQVRAFRGFDGVVAVSRPLEKELSESGVPPDRLHLIPNCLAVAGQPLSPAAARARLPHAASGRLIGWAGRLGLEKGCDVFLDALATIREAEWTAIVLGAGPEAAVLMERARRLGLEGRVVWAGVVPSAGAVFPAFDVFALSSRTEGTPMVVLEAMASGTPVVASSVGGVPDLLSEGPAGWLVPPGNPEALGAALRHALDDRDEARRRAERARSRALDAYAVEPWLDRYEAVYRRVISRT